MMNLSPTTFYNWAAVFTVQVLIGITATAQINSTQLAETMDSLFFKEDGSQRPGYSIAIVQNDSVIYQ